MNAACKTALYSVLLGTTTLGLSMATAQMAHAQVTTSAVEGFVTTESGAPITNANILVSNTSTGFSRSTTSSANGSFALRNLPVTGEYTITVTASGYQGEQVEGVMLTLGASTDLAFALAGGEMDEVITVAQRVVAADVAIGPSASFGSETLENAPAINRNIADVIRLDPRVYVDESRGDINSVQCVGQSSRFNSITLDGVALNDSFGLNANGYPTERMPFPFAALDQVSVEIAPFDVKYGGFTACNINSVTKSGTNEFHGSFFADYTDDGFKGDKAKDLTADFGSFDEIRYGIDIGGPIIKDTLFFYVAYEKLDGANVFFADPLANGDITQAEVDQIADIARNVYGYEPGIIPSSFANEDEKILVKLDWNINDQHRAAFTYDYNDGFNIVRSDGDSDELEFSNHFYERGSELNSYVGALYSDWNENFSTEFRVGYLELDNRQESLGGTDFGEMQIRAGNGVTVYLGGDDSRQSNKLKYDILDLSARADYVWGDHTFSFGAERKDLSIFNLFIQHTETEIRFNSIADFQNQLANRIYYNNAPSHNPNDAAADWGYAVNTIYAQDEFFVGDKLTVVAGLRYDWYTSDDLPVENPDFVADYGFSNAQNLDGEGLLQPRLGFTYDVNGEWELRGGAGIYSGGNPNVWLSNNYSANNITQVGALARAGRGGLPSAGIDLTSLTYVDAESGVPNSAGWAIPTIVHDPVSTGVGDNFEINYLDPNFKIPSDWKFAIGTTWTPSFAGEGLFGGDWLFQTDFLWSVSQDTAVIKRGDLVQTGIQTVNGQTVPVYDSPLEDSFVLTNADESNRAYVWSLGTTKTWDNGVTLIMGYAYSDAQDVQPMTSSVAFSNYNLRAYLDPQEEVLATSNYNIKHRFTASLRYAKEFIPGLETGMFAFLQSSSGRPYSRVDDNPNAYYNFTPFLDGGGVLLPGTRRNEFVGPSWTKIDVKFTQEVPAFNEEHNAQVYVVIDNLTNLINSDWGVLEQPSFPRALTAGQDFSLNADASTYEVRFGFNYDF